MRSQRERCTVHELSEGSCHRWHTPPSVVKVVPSSEVTLFGYLFLPVVYPNTPEEQKKRNTNKRGKRYYLYLQILFSCNNKIKKFLSSIWFCPFFPWVFRECPYQWVNRTTFNSFREVRPVVTPTTSSRGNGSVVETWVARHQPPLIPHRGLFWCLRVTGMDFKSLKGAYLRRVQQRTETI